MDATRATDTTPGSLLDERAAGTLLGKPPSTLRDWRYRGSGPSYVKCGGSVRYRLRDLEAWLDANTVHPKTGRVR